MTAILTLAIFAIVQLYLVPRAERLKRKDDQWEKDARELARLLVFDAKEVFTRVRAAIFRRSFIYEAVSELDSVNQARVDQALDENREEQQNLDAELRALDSKLEWQIDRLAARDPVAMDYRILHFRRHAISFVGLPSLSTLYSILEDTPLTRAQVEDADRQTDAALKTLTDAVTALVDHGPPPRRTGIRRWRTTFSGWVKKVTERKTTDSPDPDTPNETQTGGRD